MGALGNSAVVELLEETAGVKVMPE